MSSLQLQLMGAVFVDVGVIVIAFFWYCQMNLLLKEYILSGDGKEAERCLRDLEVPHFHHEFVYEVKASFWFEAELPKLRLS